MPASEPQHAPQVVLDTNAVLDWLLFRNPAMTTLAKAIEAGAVRWIASPRMRDELAAVLSRPLLSRWNPDSERILTTLAVHTSLCVEPVMSVGVALHCSDPDDQVFIDLALTERARWLVTRDRALLKLARRASLRGLHVVPPERWPGA